MERVEHPIDRVGPEPSPCQSVCLHRGPWPVVSAASPSRDRCLAPDVWLRQAPVSQQCPLSIGDYIEELTLPTQPGLWPTRRLAPALFTGLRGRFVQGSATTVPGWRLGSLRHDRSPRLLCQRHCFRYVVHTPQFGQGGLEWFRIGYLRNLVAVPDGGQGLHPHVDAHDGTR